MDSLHLNETDDDTPVVLMPLEKPNGPVTWIPLSLGAIMSYGYAPEKGRDFIAADDSTFAPTAKCRLADEKTLAKLREFDDEISLALARRQEFLARTAPKLDPMDDHRDLIELALHRKGNEST